MKCSNQFRKVCSDIVFVKQVSLQIKKLNTCYNSKTKSRGIDKQQRAVMG